VNISVIDITACQMSPRQMVCLPFVIYLHSKKVAVRMMKRGILLVPEIVFSARDIDNILHDVCNDWC